MKKNSDKSEKGFSLIEVVIAMGILGIVAVAFLMSINHATNTQISVDERETAKNLAESQMEYVKGLVFASTYSTADIPGYSGYTASIIADNVTSRDANIQKVTVVIQRQGRELVRLTNYKVK